jgi:hypothetical protein
MKAFVQLLLVSLAAGASIPATVTRGPTTLVLKEIGGVPGNECLTFRNNGTRPLFSTKVVSYEFKLILTNP